MDQTSRLVSVARELARIRSHDDNDPRVVEIACKYLGFDHRVTFHVDDGATFIEQQTPGSVRLRIRRCVADDRSWVQRADLDHPRADSDGLKLLHRNVMAASMLVTEDRFPFKLEESTNTWNNGFFAFRDRNQMLQQFRKNGRIYLAQMSR